MTTFKGVYPSLTHACAGFYERRRWKLRLLKSTLLAKISYAGCFGLSAAISAQFTLKMSVAVHNC